MELCTQDLRSNFPKNVPQANMWTSVQCQNPKLKFQINVKFKMNQESSYVMSKKQKIPFALKPDGFRFRRNEMQGVYFIIPALCGHFGSIASLYCVMFF